MIEESMESMWSQCGVQVERHGAEMESNGIILRISIEMAAFSVENSTKEVTISMKVAIVEGTAHGVGCAGRLTVVGVLHGKGVVARIAFVVANGEARAGSRCRRRGGGGGGSAFAAAGARRIPRGLGQQV